MVVRREKQMKTATWLNAVKRAKGFIESNPKVNPNDAEVTIYTWTGADAPQTEPPDAKRLRSIGLRVAEVSFWKPAPGSTPERPLGGGCSYMQVDVPWGAAVCLLTERLILAYAEGWTAEEIAEEGERLVYGMLGG